MWLFQILPWLTLESLISQCSWEIDWVIRQSPEKTAQRKISCKMSCKAQWWKGWHKKPWGKYRHKVNRKVNYERKRTFLLLWLEDDSFAAYRPWEMKKGWMLANGVEQIRSHYLGNAGWVTTQAYSVLLQTYSLYRFNFLPCKFLLKFPSNSF